MKVLITDGNFKHTLAAVRSLGKRGIDVTVLSDLRLSISFYSKYCEDYIIVPNPKKDARFSNCVLDIAKEGDYDVLLPISFSSVFQISKIKEKMEKYLKVPIADRKSIEVAGNKDQTTKFAEKIGIPVPKTFYPHNIEEVHDLSKNIEYPVVVKGSEESGYVGYANSPEQLISRYNRICKYSPILQEYISGEGYGFFALYNQGEPRAIFMHKRIREYPVTGGPSTFAESIYESRLKELGLKILDSLNWHGVAMVEFKKNAKNGDFVLMEINPKFWGSLELAIASGVDFPYLACEMAVKGDIEPVFEYKKGVRFRWLFPGDLFHAITNPKSILRFFADFFDRDIKYDIEFNDLKPNIMQVGMTAAEFMLRIKERRFWRAHGRVKI